MLFECIISYESFLLFSQAFLLLSINLNHLIIIIRFSRSPNAAAVISRSIATAYSRTPSNGTTESAFIYFDILQKNYINDSHLIIINKES